MYIHQRDDWPHFTWDKEKLAGSLSGIHHRQGRLVGRMEGLGFPLQSEAMLQTLTLEVTKTSEIEGEILNTDQVRSSIARHLGMDIAGLVPSDRNVDGVVEMMLDATQNFQAALTAKRLFDWHTSLFPQGESGLHKMTIGNWRGETGGPMQVVSGPMGLERVHFEAPESALLPKEMSAFLAWFNAEMNIDPVLKAALAHLWFVTIHPFDDGNGRIARTIADMQLARADGIAQRFYSMSAQIRLERKAYYDILEKTQKGTLDVTEWLEWFLACLDRAMSASETTLGGVLHKARTWEVLATKALNERQRLMINRLLDGFEGKLTSSKWAKIAKCSSDTALRDIQNLIEQNVLVKEESGGRSTSYVLNENRP
jgi:Fic family protein